MPSVWLEFIEGAESGRRFEIPAETAEVIVGRAPECGLVVTESSASRRHAKLRRDGERVVLEDLQSANGTALNGQPVTGAVPIRDGDVVSFGNLKVKCVWTPAAPLAVKPPTDLTPPLLPGPVGIIELLLIGVGSFVAVVVFGWLLR